MPLPRLFPVTGQLPPFADLAPQPSPVPVAAAGPGFGLLSVLDVAASITTLMQEYGIARNTARHALAVLAEEGLIEITPGWGSFVKPGA